MIDLPEAFDLDVAADSEAGGEGRLEVGYYTASFRLVLDEVESRYADLLTSPERAFIDDFRSLGEQAQRLYVRLAMRKGPVFRRDRLDYPEIEDLDAAAAALVGAGFLDTAEDENTLVLLGALRRAELLALGRSFGSAIPSTVRREQLVEALAQTPESTVAALRSVYAFLRPLRLEVLWTVRLLFFGNLEQDWREFVLRDLGVQRFEPYALHRETRLFPERRAVDDTLTLGLARLALRPVLAGRRHDADALEVARDIASVALDRDDWHPLARPHADRILAKVGRALERAGEWHESLELYARTQAPPARERRCRVLERLGRFEEALERCEQLLAEPLDASEAEFGPRFAHRLRRKLGLEKTSWKRPRRPVETLDVEPAILQPPRPAVEWLTLALLAEKGQPGIYSENWLWRCLFGLAFWDVIFAAVPGAFAHPFQLGPLDLMGPDFYARRRGAIEVRLEELRAESDLGARLGAVYADKRGTSNAFVAWHPQLEQTLRFAYAHIPGGALATVCERLALDPGRHRRGLPDVLVLRPESPVGFELLEIKAPGDQLRPEQGAWIDYLNARGVPSKVLRLRPLASAAV